MSETKLPDVKKMIAQARSEAYQEQKSQLVLAKVPIEAPPQGNLNATEVVRKKKLLKYESNRLYQQLGITSQSLNAVRAVYLNLQRIIDTFRESKTGSKAEQEKLKLERTAYEEALRVTGVLLKSLKEIGQQKVAQVKQMEDELTRNRSDIYKVQRTAKNSPEKGESEADKQNRKAEPILQSPYPMHKAPSVFLSPKKLLIQAKKELKEKEDSTSAERAARVEANKQSPETT